MKTFLSLIILILFINGCSQKMNTPIEPIQGNTVNLFFNVDNRYVPANVIIIKAFLISNELDTLSVSFNIISDTTAKVSINNYSGKNWNLKLEALDDNSQIVYAGETEVNVLAEVNIQVYLTFYPTGNGVGNIAIIISEKSQNKGWFDHQYNPILTPNLVPQPIPNSVMQAKVIFINNKYKMWYDKVYDGAKTEICYSESQDGISWSNFSTSPVLKTGDLGSWDKLAVQVGAVLFDNNQYKMFYTGFATQYNNWNIGLATSTDGIKWTKLDQPVLMGINSEYQLHVDAVLKYNNQYYMYYTIRDPRYFPIRYSIGLALSDDGLTWERVNNNPILKQSLSWEGNSVLFPSVIIEQGEFKMVYMSPLSNGFGFATSNDGIYWTKSSGNPFFTNNETHNNWAIGGISYPNFIKNNNVYRIYYSGQSYDNSSNLTLGIVEKNSN